MSSIDIRQKPNGKWEVRWRENGQRKGRTISRERDAISFAASVRTRLEMGGVVQLDTDVPTLNEWIETYWSLYAVPRLEKNTRQNYKRVWANHLQPRLGRMRLRAITTGIIDTELVEPMRVAMADQPKGGEPTILMALALLSGMMSLAVKHEHVPVNPVLGVSKPKQPPRDTTPLWPSTVERIRSAILAPRPRKDTRGKPEQRRTALRDATMVSLLAYAGLRPEEMLALEWGDIRKTKIVVERAVTLGETKETKTGRDREVDLLAPLAADLAEWRLASGGQRSRDLLFSRPRDGGEWRDHDYRNWRRRSYQDVLDELGLTLSRRPYDLRVSFASLLIWEGRTVVEVAEQLGNSPETCLRDYARLFRDAPDERVPAEQAIREAREAERQRLAG